MTEANSGTPGAPPINPAPAPPELNAPSNFVRTRSAQIAEKMQQPAPGNEPAQPAADVRPQPQQQEQPPAKIKVGDADFTADELQSAIAAKAEADILKNSRPKSEAEFLAKNSETFKLPEGVNYAFNEQDPALAAARKFALANNLTQEQFSGMLDLFVSTQVGSLMNVQQTRQKNLDALGAAGPQRIDAVARWLNARAGKDGSTVADFIKQYPSAPFVKAVETLIKQFAGQGGASYSGQHRETADAEPGKIAGYDSMSFTQKRVAQMAQMLNRPGYRGGGGRRE
jgi:hypothetical protein